MICALATIYMLSFFVRVSSYLAMASWTERTKQRHGIKGDLKFDTEALKLAATSIEDSLRQIQEFQNRIEGKSRPFEGIRIVRERKKEDSAAKAA